MLLLDEPRSDLAALLKALPGPDFPTGGIILGRQGIVDAYRTGRGILQVRGKAGIEKNKKGDRESIVITEIPFQVNKARLIELIAHLVNEKRLEGISAIRDESDREGMRVVVDVKRDAVAQVVLNQLLALTPLQSSFGIIFLAIVDGQPRVLPLKDLLRHFLDHRRAVVVRRTQFDLKKAEERAHPLPRARSRSRASTASSRDHPGQQGPRRGQGGLTAEVVLEKKALETSSESTPRDLASARPEDGLLRPRRDPGAGDSRHAPPAPHGPRAREDPAEYRDVLALIADLRTSSRKPARSPRSSAPNSLP